LKSWCREGVVTIFLKGTTRGTFAVPRDWTDLAEPQACGPSAILAFPCLIEIVEMVRAIDRRSQEGLDK
jgi:hypothetical protein